MPDCEFISTELPDGTYQLVCPRCKYETISEFAYVSRTCMTREEEKVILERLYQDGGKLEVKHKKIGRLQQAWNLAKATAQHVAAGLPIASPELAEARLSICRTCDKFVNNITCALCTCNMPYKVTWAEQKCPIGKWTVLDLPKKIETPRPTSLIKKKEIWVAGFPSFYGGADTELDHQIDLWTAKGLEVNLVTPGNPDPIMKAKCETRGCIIHPYYPEIFTGKTLISFCNGEFLEHLPSIMKVGRPAKVIWVNCMTWTFEKEREAHKNGWLDYHLFQTDYQRNRLKPELESLGVPVRELEYIPYFNVDSNSAAISYEYRQPKDYFVVGRISRDDGYKYPADLWETIGKIKHPTLPTAGCILGFAENAEQKCGPVPKPEFITFPPGGIPASTFYKYVDCVIHMTGGSRENLPRIMFECWCAGVPLIAENNYGFKDYIQDGVTGFLCDTSAQMAARATELANNEGLRKAIIEAGRNYLKSTFGNIEYCWKGWKTIYGP